MRVSDDCFANDFLSKKRWVVYLDGTASGSSFGSKDDHGDVRSFVQRHLGHSRRWNLARLQPQWGNGHALQQPFRQFSWAIDVS